MKGKTAYFVAAWREQYRFGGCEGKMSTLSGGPEARECSHSFRSEIPLDHMLDV